MSRSRRAKRAGQLNRLDAGKETLDNYVEYTWAPIHLAPLAPKTRELYAGLYDKHISPWLGSYQLRQLTPEDHRPLAGQPARRWRSDRVDPQEPDAARRNPSARVGGRTDHEQPAAPRAQGSAGRERRSSPAGTSDDRSDMQRSEAARLHGGAFARVRRTETTGSTRPTLGDVGERTLTVHSPKTHRHRQQPRSVRLLAPLAQDLREWRLLSGRPNDNAPLIPGGDGGEWTEVGYRLWSQRAWATALSDAGIPYQRP
jgi:hypothetical protein